MGMLELLILAAGLAMDAFAVAVCKGLGMQRVTLRSAAVVGAWFGAFQALMPILGYLLGVQFAAYIAAVDHWVAFLLLAAVGVNMLREATGGEAHGSGSGTGPRTMFAAAVATSIDALAVGVTFALIAQDTKWIGALPAAALIGTVTFFVSACGVKVGGAFGEKYRAKAEIAGGAALLAVGLKILLSDLLGG